jgi:N-methylhydantoinase A/oxoprolinase/acetone carboxylase beta subunit
MYSIAKDVGGMFTDVVLRDDRGIARESKAPTSRRALSTLNQATEVHGVAVRESSGPAGTPEVDVEQTGSRRRALVD